MAAIPDVTISISDGALGLVEPADASSAIIGSCSGGVANTLYAFTDPATLVSELVSGPAVEAAAHALAVGGGTVFVLKVDNTSTPGVAGSVTHVGTGLSVLTVTGAPYDAYQVRITILQGGTNPAAGTATFKFSLDGGDNYSGEIAVPTSGSYPVAGTNLTLAFSAASLVAGDTYSFDCTAPGYNSTEMTAAFNALVADPRTWKFVHLVGSASSAAAQATIAVALAALVQAQEAVYRFTYAMTETPDLGDGTTGDSALITAYVSVASVRLMVCAGFAEITSTLTGRAHKRSAAWPIAARRHKAPISEDCTRVKSGALPGVTKLYRDEQIHRGLDAQRFATLRTLIGKQGFYITNGRMMAPSGSDFGFVQHREMMDVACATARAGLLNYLGDGVRVNGADAQAPSVPGGIYEPDARVIEADVGGQLNAVLLSPNHVSSTSIQINRADNIISTSNLRVKVRLVPKAYARQISADMGFSNPALTIV
jgi:hypothetical protein